MPGAGCAAQGALEFVSEVCLFGIAGELALRDGASSGDPLTKTHGWHWLCLPIWLKPSGTLNIRANGEKAGLAE
jgi:hypothetical protein